MTYRTDLTERAGLTASDLLHQLCRMEIELSKLNARVEPMERMLAHHVSMRLSQERVIAALFANVEFMDASAAYWRERYTELRQAIETQVERKVS